MSEERNKELCDQIIELRELMRKGMIQCPECVNQDSARTWCDLCLGKGYVHYSIITMPTLIPAD